MKGTGLPTPVKIRIMPLLANKSPTSQKWLVDCMHVSSKGGLSLLFFVGSNCLVVSSSGISLCLCLTLLIQIRK